jgi:hypothetical protein
MKDEQLITVFISMQCSFQCAVSIWNELPNHIKDIDTLNRFKLEYKCHLLHGFLESS